MAASTPSAGYPDVKGEVTAQVQVQPNKPYASDNSSMQHEDSEKGV